MCPTLSERDARVIWHPATHFADLEQLPPVPIARAEGVWLHTSDGRRILDGISSWWTSLHGHGQPAIAAAVADQVRRLDHVMFAGFTHEPGVTLAEGLLELAGAGPGRVFYADAGSAAIEIAMKMSFQARKQTGQPERTRFAALARSYHGETLGALSVCATPDWREPFGELLSEALYLPAPLHPDHSPEQLGTDLGADSPQAAWAEELLRAHAGELTALLVEPVVQCAGRMAMHGTGYLRRVTRVARELGIHVIADEIAVGLWRTGRPLAGSWAELEPDLLCLGKALSGGVLPLSAVLVREELVDAFRGPPSRSFLHSHTFTGNPIACAAGCAGLELLRAPGTAERVSALAAALATRREQVAAACPEIVHHRQAGLVVALDLDPDLAAGLPGARLSRALRKAALDRGVLLRPLHDTIYWMPPLCVGDDELDRLATVTAEAIAKVRAAVRRPAG